MDWTTLAFHCRPCWWRHHRCKHGNHRGRRYGQYGAAIRVLRTCRLAAYGDAEEGAVVSWDLQPSGPLPIGQHQSDGTLPPAGHRGVAVRVQRNVDVGSRGTVV